MTLSPSYDLVNTTLVNPADDEEMALNLNGKKKN
jgi:serine/threonine-protein kinase HipA